MNPILLMKDHPDLIQQEKSYNERVRFLIKRTDDVFEELKKARREFWLSIDTYLEKNKLIEDASRKNFGVIDGVLYEKYGEDSEVSFLKSLQREFEK